MDERTLFRNIMNYGEFHRMPVWHTGEWVETADEWQSQGLSKDADRHEFFGTVGFPWTVPTHLDRRKIGSKDAGFIKGVGLRPYNMLYPLFTQEIFEETEEYQIFRQEDGVIVKKWKYRSSLPQFMKYTFTDSSGWEEYQCRLQLNPNRIPEDMAEILAQMAGYDGPIRVRTGSLVGVIRNWMGVENFAYLQHDDQDLIGEIVNTISDLICWELDQILPLIKVDLGWFWEDICGKDGPLVSPKVFEKHVVPGYHRVSSKLEEYGVKLLAVDSDGVLDCLIPGWLEGGVNILYPIEIGTWHTDPIILRRHFGRELRFIGAIDKLEIARGKKAIDAEIERRLPLMQEGGYIPTPDHFVVPGTKLEDYCYYLEKIRSLRF